MPFQNRLTAAKRVLEMVDVVKRHGDLTVCESVDLVVERGERHCYSWANGAGKSTLLKMMAAIELPSWGQVLVGQKVVRGYYAPASNGAAQ